MKIIKFNGLKPEIANLDYNAIKEEMERCGEGLFLFHKAS